MAPSTRLLDLVDWYQRSHPEVNDAEFARRTGMSRANLSQWRSNGVRGWPARTTLDGLASATGRPYREILDAALADTGYAVEYRTSVPTRTYREVLDDAVRVLTEAARLTNHRVRQNPDGTWEPDPNADVLAIDWAAFVTDALAGAAANIGGITAILAGRPGSWEASVIRDALSATVGADEWDLWRHRTEPLDVVIHPERVLFDTDASTWFEEIETDELELERRENAVVASHTYSYPGHELSEEMRRYYTDRGVQIIDGPPPPPPTVEEMQAAINAANDHPHGLAFASDNQDEQDALAAITQIRERFQAQQREELAAYGDQLAVAVRTALAALDLPVPVTVTVDLDTPWDKAPDTPLPDWAEGAIDQATANALAGVARPDCLPGTPLQRTEAQP